MHIREETLDDVLNTVFARLLKSHNRIQTTRGAAKELVGVLISISNPRARFSHTENRATLFTCLGETLWYLAGSDRLDFIEHYIPDYRKFLFLPSEATTTRGAYGPRLFGSAGQIPNILEMLKRKRTDTRQAVVQIFDATDLTPPTNDIPCTCTIQFLPRRGTLHTFVSMRSNDAYLGLTHDIFAFTFLQELVARSASMEVGHYYHAVGSLHLYEEHYERAAKYLEEGLQEPSAMPPMPERDPWEGVDWLLSAAALLRESGPVQINTSAVDRYWTDLARILRIRELLITRDLREVVREKNRIDPVYESFVRGKLQRATSAALKAEPVFPGF